MKKTIKCMIFILLILIVFSACSKPDNYEENRKTKVVATIFPLYDWCRNIIGDDPDVELVWLIDDAADLHNYQPTAEDIINISTADLFICIGGESDEWVEDVLEQNSSLNVLNAMEVIEERLKEEELIEGMEADEEEEEESEYDEHVWLSLKNASLICKAINRKLNEICSADFTDNTTAYCEKLNKLDQEYERATENTKRNVLLFADRFPFRYLTDDYDLSYYAAFKGCSAESEASFETVRFLSEKVKELDLPAVICIEGGNQKIAKTVIENASGDRSILVMDSMQLITEGDYLEIMKENLEVLKKALN